jgi:hypothetical protein
VSADHKRPLFAFVLLTIACLLIVVTGARSEAVHEVLDSGAHRVVAGVRLALDHDRRDPAPVAVASTSFDRDDAHRRRDTSRPATPPVTTPSTPAPSAATPSVTSVPEASATASPVARAHRAPRHVVRAPRGDRFHAPSPHRASRARVERAADPVRHATPSRAAHGAAAAASHAHTGAPHGRSVSADARAKARPHGKALGHRTHVRTRPHHPHTGGHHPHHGRAKRHHRH